MKEMKVDPIKNGTVIDHIAPGRGLQVVDLLNIGGSRVVMIGLNLSSEKLGRKDIVKIENRELTSAELSSIALISPEATYSIIEEYEVVRKSKVELPRYVDRIIVCPNPQCVTNIEGVKTRFMVESKDRVKVRCAYCEKNYPVSEVEISI